MDCHTTTSVAFWPALQCLSTLLDQLGSRFWQFVPTTCNFNHVLKCILKSNVFEDELLKCDEDRHESCFQKSSKNEDSAGHHCAVKSEFPLSDHVQRIPFNWIVPFLQSLLDFGEAAFETISTLFQTVHSFPKKNSSSISLFYESMTTLSRMIELLFSKRAYTILYKFKVYWLPSVKFALTSVQNIACLHSMKHIYMVLLQILHTEEARTLPLTESVIINIKEALKGFVNNACDRATTFDSKEVVEHVTKVLKLLSETHSDPTFDVASDHEGLPTMEVESDAERGHSPMQSNINEITIKSEYDYSSSPVASESPSSPRRKPRKKAVSRKSQAVKKSKPIAKNILSDESTDELEDFDVLTHDTKRKRKCLPKRRDPSANLMYKLKPHVVILSDDTTDDMEDVNVTDIKIEPCVDDDVFDIPCHPATTFLTMPASLKLACSSAHSEPSCSETSTTKSTSTKSRTPLRLKKSSSKSGFVCVEKHPVRTNLCATQYEAMSMNDVHSGQDLITSKDPTTDKDINLDNTITESMEDRLSSQMELYTDSEKKEQHVEDKRRDSINKVNRWLKSGSGSVSALDKLESKASFQDASDTTPDVSAYPSTTEVVCDGSEDHGSTTEPVTSTEWHKESDTEMALSKVETTAPDAGRQTRESTSSSSSSLPPVEWKSESHCPKVTKESGIHKTEDKVEEGGVPRVHSLASDVDHVSEYTVESSVQKSPLVTECETTKNLSPKQHSVSDVTVCVAQTSAVKSTLKFSDTSKERLERSNDLYESISEDDEALERFNLEDKVSSGFSPSEKAALLGSANDDSTVAEKVPKVASTNKYVDQPSNPNSPFAVCQKTPKPNLYTVKASKTMLTEVPGMTYSHKKAALKDRMDAQLPCSSTSLLRSPIKKSAFLSAKSSSSKSHTPSTENSNRVSTSTKSSSSAPHSSFRSGVIRTPSSESHSHLDPKHSLTRPMHASTARPHAVQAQPSTSATLSRETQRLIESVCMKSNNTVISKQPKPSTSLRSNMPVKAIPLKPTILPKADDFLQEVLSWDAGAFLLPGQTDDGKLIEPTINFREEPPMVPVKFESYDHYLQTFKPLLFLELANVVSLC